MVDSIIEIPRNSRVKYEIDKTTNLVFGLRAFSISFN